MNKSSFTLVTGNQGKLNEWRRLLPADFGLESADIDLTEIQSADPELIVADKARRAYDILKRPVVVEDVSAGLNRLGGLPGPFVKFFLKVLGEDALRKLALEEGEAATVACVVAYCDGGQPLCLTGTVIGSIVTPRGLNGFGFDKTFVPTGQTKTYAEMTDAEKDLVSHRAKAIEQFVIVMRERQTPRP